MNHKFNKYLNKKSIHEKWKIQRIPKKQEFDFIITIPCFDEYNFIFKTLDSINSQNQKLLQNTLVSIVINNSDKENKEILENNIKTYNKILEYACRYEIIVVDAFSSGNALKQKEAGVGMARKISVDIALNFSRPSSIICFIDADTELSKNYLSTIYSSFHKHAWSAATVNFEHLKDEPRTDKLIENYEKFLKITSEKLRESNSPYSYVPLGSTMVCTQSAYISIGGMNRRKAAEDFYFLQELQKSVGVYQLNNVLIYPSSRYLNRSYLGTSTRLQKSLDGELDINSLYYSLNSYRILSKLITSTLDSQNKSYKEVLNSCYLIDSKLPDILKKFNFKKAWAGINNAPTNKHFINQFHRWFDAFKTLKLLKYYS